MGVDTKVSGRSPDAGKEQHEGAGTAAKKAEAGHKHKPGAPTAFKAHIGANDTNDNCSADLIPNLGSG